MNNNTYGRVASHSVVGIASESLRRSSLTSLLVGALLTAAACSGEATPAVASQPRFTVPAPAQTGAVPVAEVPIAASGETDVPVAVPDASPRVVPPTPLARLTNDEFVRSLTQLLELSGNVPALRAAREALAAEPNDNGLVNNANNQVLTQIAVGGFEQLVAAASEAYLDGVSNEADLAARLGCAALGEDEISTCVSNFGSDLMERGYRRGPSPEHAEAIGALLTRINEIIRTGGEDPASFSNRSLKVRSLIGYVALSPEFLLLAEPTTAPVGQARQLGPYEVGSRLSYFLTGAPPDALLLQAAAGNRLGTAAERLSHVDRLLQTSDGRDQFAGLFMGWLGVHAPGEATKDYEALATLMRDWIGSEGPFSGFYQAPVEVTHTDGTTSFEPLGVLGSQAFVSAHTEFPAPSFITRGVFVVENLLCGTLPQDIPDEAFEQGSQTELQVFEGHAKQPCASCHVIFDNYGAVFQQFEPETNRFDAALQPFGTNFDLFTIGDVSGEVSSLSELGSKLAASQTAATCMTELLYRNATRRDVDEGGLDDEYVRRLSAQWLTGADTSMKALLRKIVESDEFSIFVP